MRKLTQHLTRWICGTAVAAVLVFGSVQALQANRAMPDCWRWPVPGTGGQGKDCQIPDDCLPECEEALYFCNQDNCCECFFR